MKCFMCCSDMKKYFDKNIAWGGVSNHEYVRCENCGMVVDKTAYETDINQLVDDICYEHSYQGKDENIVDPRWIARIEMQAGILAQMFHAGVFMNNERAVDYGSGDGKLSDEFQKKYKIALDKKESDMVLYPRIMKYDKFMQPKDDMSYISEKDLLKKKFSIVICCSVFEHLFGRKDIEAILDLLDDTGTLCLHVLVCEEVPNDPDWFYLLKDHVTLWTNKAMSILYNEYGFVGCAYHVEARMWFFFKDFLKYELLKEKHNFIEGI